jgi:hypothetical protein
MSSQATMDINEDVNRKEDATSIRVKNEALLTAGMGYGNKKKAHLEAFWSIILPGLLEIGWKTVSDYSSSGKNRYLNGRILAHLVAS